MSFVYKMIPNVPNPELLEATLLSVEELEACEGYIEPVPWPLPNYYYLRTPYPDNQIGLAQGDMLMEPTDPAYEDVTFQRGRIDGTGIRPIVRIANPVLSDEVTLKPGDKIQLAWYNFTVIADTILLLDDYINLDEEEGLSVFDEETNIYENSSAKKKVDEWFESLKQSIQH